MQKTLPKSYESQKYEDSIYKRWEQSGAFTPKIDPKKKPFTISMPPPNATGMLHLGHATMLALEDIMIRYKRMQGYSALWLPGTDHASIATQNKVEAILAKEGKNRDDLGRRAFLKRVREYVANSKDTIRNQIRKMGSSCDWTRERYTLDKGLSRAVSEIFVRMYKDGLIYRGHRIVNWCPRCSSTLADDEVEYKECRGKLYYIIYGPVVLATTRPETKFGDTAVAVHPKDKRYKHLVGKKIKIRTVLGESEIQVIADSAIDPDFGTGAVKVTPAHDPMDFEIGQRHGLEVRQVIDKTGCMNEKAGKYKGMPTLQAREAVVKDMKKLGLLEKVENYDHNLSICYRCGTTIEPLISLQWFVDVNKPIIPSPRGRKLTIKEKAIEVVKKGEIEILPDRFNKTYFHWMENLRDWCISRQIWFGHRIPVYYCSKCEGDPIVSADTLKCCPRCHGKLKQDPDTLDTWFSSGQWTYSTLGWPEKTADLKYFHPTSVLETGYDILFFWVARMIIMTTYAMGEIPFEKVYLHGLIRDKQGRKMSKSLGNGIDPLDMIKKYGADAVRLSLVVGSTPGNDMRLYEEKIAGYRNFVNKIWNAARFALMNQDEEPTHSSSSSADKPPEAHSICEQKISSKNLSLADKWILSRTNALITQTTRDLEKYRFSDAGMRIYNFTWNEFCDWYLECSKVRPNSAVLKYVLSVILKLAHPFMPFVTEVLFRELTCHPRPEAERSEPSASETSAPDRGSIFPNREDASLLISESWPKVKKAYDFPLEGHQMNVVFDIITGIRAIRAESNVEPKKKIHAILYAHGHRAILEEKLDVIMRLSGLSHLEILGNGPKITQAISKFVDEVEIYLPLKDLIDYKQEKTRLQKEVNNLLSYISILKKKLSNKKFIQKAPKTIVDKEKSKLQSEIKRLKKLEDQIKQLKE